MPAQRNKNNAQGPKQPTGRPNGSRSIQRSQSSANITAKKSKEDYFLKKQLLLDCMRLNVARSLANANVANVLRLSLVMADTDKHFGEVGQRARTRNHLLSQWKRYLDSPTGNAAFAPSHALFTRSEILDIINYPGELITFSCNIDMYDKFPRKPIGSSPIQSQETEAINNHNNSIEEDEQLCPDDQDADQDVEDPDKVQLSLSRSSTANLLFDPLFGAGLGDKANTDIQTALGNTQNFAAPAPPAHSTSNAGNVLARKRRRENDGSDSFFLSADTLSSIIERAVSSSSAVVGDKIDNLRSDISGQISGLTATVQAIDGRVNEIRNIATAAQSKAADIETRHGQQLLNLENRLQNLQTAEKASLSEEDLAKIRGDILEEVSRGSADGEDTSTESFIYKALAYADNQRRMYMAACFEQRSRGTVKVDFADGNLIKFNVDGIPEIADPTQFRNMLGCNYDINSIWRKDNGKVSAMINIKCPGGRKEMAEATQNLLKRRYQNGIEGRHGINLRTAQSFDFTRYFQMWKGQGWTTKFAVCEVNFDRVARTLLEAGRHVHPPLVVGVG